MKLTFAGLGVMGFPMAGHLASAGHEMTVFNRSAGKAARWVEAHGGASAPTVAEAARDAEIFLLCVGADDDVREVVTQAASAMRAGGIIVDHTTASADIAQEMAALCEGRGLSFVDAPVSGGQAGAENGQLTIMCGGDVEAFARIAPVIDAYAKATRLMGPIGSGQLTKMCNQICIAGIVQGLSESLHFAKRAGLDTDAVLEAISKGAAQSWQMDNRWPTMAEGKFDFGFAVDWMRKDLSLVFQTAEQIGATLDMTRLVDGFYADVQAMGGARWDTSSLVARLEPPKA